ncbi:MAG: DUF1501 domain-containing protein [Verrucomicrobiales bacterium]|nr:DUF1501 domain-containing protein [Verrucomicrobiales bacterium]
MNKSEISRRHFVNRAAKSFLGVSAIAGLPKGLTAAGAGASTLKQLATAKQVIYLYMSGGMSHIDTFDPKKTGSEVMGPNKRIPTSADDMFFTNYLGRLRRHADKLCVINSMTSTQGAHKQGNYYMHTSYELRSSIKHPAMGAWTLQFQGKNNPEIPANVLIGGDSNHPGSGFLESKLSPVALTDPEGGLRNGTMRMEEEKFKFHLDLAKKLDQPFIEKYDQKNVRAYTDMYDDAITLMNSRDLKAFDLADEPTALKEKYGKDRFGQGCLLARRLVEHGVRFVEVSTGGWDTHSSNFVTLPEKAEVLDQALSALLSDLERRGMLDDTLVVVATEFGRTPEINTNEGRDHHPQAFSCLLAGGGVKGGTVHGKTDERGAKILADPVTIPDLNATIGYALGLPLDQVLYSPSMRPFTVADKGKPVVSLFG